MRIVSILSGIVLVAAGIWCFLNTGFAFLSFAFLPGTAVFLFGAVGIAVFLFDRGKDVQDEWRFADGIAAAVFGTMILSGRLVTDESAIVAFGMWLLCSGANRVVSCLALQKEKRKGWYFGLIFGALSITAAVFAVANPFLSGFGMAVTIGSALILQGGGTIAASVLMGSQK